MIKLSYYESASTSKPQILEITKNTVYFRKDIRKNIVKLDNGKERIEYQYQEATMSIDEFNKNGNTILAEQIKATDDGQTILMDAIADLYETVVMLQTQLEGGGTV